MIRVLRKRGPELICTPGPLQALTVFLKGGGTVPFPYTGNLPRQYGYCVEPDQTACAVIAPGAKAPPALAETDGNEVFRCTFGHGHEVLLT